PLPMALGGARFLVVAIDYITKRVEAKSLVSITGKHMEKFAWEHIVSSQYFAKDLAYTSPSPPSNILKQMDKWRSQIEKSSRALNKGWERTIKDG
ncbi:hypothetical protein Tco_1550707, partial [Tanacetum coccineum]